MNPAAGQAVDNQAEGEGNTEDRIRLVQRNMNRTSETLMRRLILAWAYVTDILQLAGAVAGIAAFHYYNGLSSHLGGDGGAGKSPIDTSPTGPEGAVQDGGDGLLVYLVLQAVYCGADLMCTAYWHWIGRPYWRIMRADEGALDAVGAGGWLGRSVLGLQEVTRVLWYVNTLFGMVALQPKDPVWQRAPVAAWIATSMIVFNLILLGIPIAIIFLVACSFPLLIIFLRPWVEELNGESMHGRHQGATAEQINALPIEIFHRCLTTQEELKPKLTTEIIDEGAGQRIDASLVSSVSSPTPSVTTIPASGQAACEPIAPEDAKCIICLGVYGEGEELRRLPCRHHYHRDCIDQWLRLSGTCPLCVTPIHPSLVQQHPHHHHQIEPPLFVNDLGDTMGTAFTDDIV